MSIISIKQYLGEERKCAGRTMARKMWRMRKMEEDGKSWRMREMQNGKDGDRER